eukprot:TRINITY_DN771_c0_g3_i2.p1 TRINITY_DN771_c0_g3~~TRINITY_DN771_c0_g3_i2.p1  ORF type:complete len:1469 (-),score=859.98 TRINITY_DN771_c0_g3_i2:128-4390(-)
MQQFSQQFPQQQQQQFPQQQQQQSSQGGRPSPFTSAQIHQLKAQMVALRHLSMNQPLSDTVLNALKGNTYTGFPTNPATVQTSNSGTNSNVAGLANQINNNSSNNSNGNTNAVGTGAVSASQNVVTSSAPSSSNANGISASNFPPSNVALQSGAEAIQKAQAAAVANQKAQMIKSANAGPAVVAPVATAPPLASMPLPSLDPGFLLAERENQIKSRIAARLQELENIAPTTSEQLLQKVEIEKTQLRLLEIQRATRQQILKQLEHIAAMESTTERSNMKRSKKQIYREARLKESERIKLDQDQKKAKLHRDFVNSIIMHQKEVKEINAQSSARLKRVTRQVVKFHQSKQKREQQVRDKETKDRIKALRENDEEGYLKLLEKTKNERVLQLISQTDDFLRQIGAKVRQARGMYNTEGGAEEDDDAEIERKIAEKYKLDQAKAAEGNDEGDETSSLAPEDDEAPASAAGASKNYYTIAHAIEERIEAQPSILVGGTLKPYQIVGLQWLVSLYNNNLNGVLADEMGLGKTIQTISLITYLMEKKGNNGPFLVVTPLTTLDNWSSEFAKWAPSVITIVYKGTQPVRKHLYQTEIAQGKFNVVLTTYDFVLYDKSYLSKVNWNYIIVDEGHRMKNAKCKLTISLSKYYKSRHRVLLTGTPLQNSLPELWSLLNFLLPSIFNSVENFEQWFNAPFANTVENVDINEEETLLIIHRLHKVIRPFLLRRLKKDVESQLPEKVESVIYCPLTIMQRILYDNMSDRQMLLLDPSQNKKNVSQRGLKNVIMQLRKVCNHPFLFNDTQFDYIDENLVRTSGKFDMMDRMLLKLKASGHRVLIFSQMTQLLDVMGFYMEHRGFKYLRLDGSTKTEERGDMLRKFNAVNSEYFAFILSTRAGGLGLNLQTADTVIIFDSDWNPQMDLQAQDRAHRIGQKNQVRVFRLISLNTVEEAILKKATQKLEVDRKIIQAGMFNANSSAEERKSFLRDVLREEKNRVDTDESIPTPERLNQFLARSKEEFELFTKMDEEEERRGHKVPRLITKDELPQWISNPIIDEKEVTVEYGRGRRERGDVCYNDNMSDSQFFRMMEGEEGAKEGRKRARPFPTDEYDDDDDDDDDDVSDFGEEPQSSMLQDDLALEDINVDLEEVERFFDEGIDADDSFNKSSGKIVIPRRGKAIAAPNDDDDDLFDEEETPKRRGKGRRGTPAASSSSSSSSSAFSSPPPVSTPTVRSSRGTPKTESTDDATPKHMRKRRKIDNTPLASSTTLVPVPAPSPASVVSPRVRIPSAESVEKMQRIWDLVHELMDLSSDPPRQRAELFIVKPSRRHYPDYYKVILQPIDLTMIQKKISSYKSLDKFVEDFRLLFTNAMTFNQEESLVYQDALAMQQVFESNLSLLFPDGKFEDPPLVDSSSSALALDPLSPSKRSRRK